MCYCPTPTLHLNLALTGDGAFLFSPQKTYSAWFISILNYGDTENVLINHLLLVIPMSYPCHFTNLCPHKPHKHTDRHRHTHTETDRQTDTRRHTHTHTNIVLNSDLFSLYSLYIIILKYSKSIRSLSCGTNWNNKISRVPNLICLNGSNAKWSFTCKLQWDLFFMRSGRLVQ